jgi:hypothetical protein
VSWLVPLLLIALIGPPLVVAFARMGELFVLRVRGGKVLVVRGRIPQRLLDDIRDVVRSSRVGDGVLRCVVEDGRAAIRASNDRLTSAAQQQLRNTLGMWPVVKIRSAPKRRG